MIERVADAVEDNLDLGKASLQLEIVAEAARNPRIAEMVHDADALCRSGLGETLRTLRPAAGHEDSEAALSGIVEALAAMFGGLRIRAIRNPGLDEDGVVQVLRRMVHNLLMQIPGTCVANDGQCPSSCSAMVSCRANPITPLGADNNVE